MCVNGKCVDDFNVYFVFCYFVVNIFLIFVGFILLIFFDGLDLLMVISVVVLMLMNIGLGFGGVGFVDNYVFFFDMSKWFFLWNMFVGWFEFFLVFVIFYLLFWCG